MMSMRREVQKAREIIGPLEDPILDLPLKPLHQPSVRIVEQRWVKDRREWVTTRVVWEERPPEAG